MEIACRRTDNVIYQQKQKDLELRNNRFINNKTVRRLVVAVVGIFVAGALTACGKEDSTPTSILSGFGKNELFRIGDVSCSVPEYMVFLTNTQNQYEHVYGSQIWEVALGDVTLEDNVKDTVLAKIAQIKTMSLLAEEKGITLSENQTGKIQAAAGEYFGSLSEEEVTLLGITQEDIAQLYSEYLLADLVYQQIIDGVDPEISDDEARTITVDQIHMKTYTIDSQGTRIEYSETMKAETEEDMEDILYFLNEEGRDFTELAGKYNEADTVRISFRKGEVDTALEEAGFSLATDQISDVIETADGYYILKCISTYDKEQTDANKELIVQQRKNEAFGEAYDAFVETLSKKLNEKLWNGIELLHQEGVDTDNFFEIFEEYFS